MSPQALARENLRQLSQRIQRRRARARETILYDLHQGVKSVEAQVHKQVEMVLSRLKEAPGSRYAFALTNSFLAQIPATLSNSLLPSAISAVADSVASQTNRSLTTMRGDMDEDDSESDEPQNGEGEEENDFYGESINHSHSKRIAHRRRRSRMSPPSPPRTFGRPVHDDEDSTSSLSPSHVMPHHHYHHHHQSDPLQMSLSSSGASEILAASQYHSFSNACSQVLNAALPSFLPSMVAPLVCVFSYPSPTASSSAPENPIHPLDTTSSSSSSSSRPNSEAKKEKDFVFPWGVPGAPSSSPAPPKPPSSSLPDPGIVVLNSKAWTTAEREALYLAATRFRLRGQWAKIREHMNLHRTDDEIAAEYQRLYGFNEDASRHGGQDDEMASADDEDEEDQEDNPAIGTPASPSSLSSDVADDADDEAEATPTVFMKFGGSHASARRQLQSRITHHGYPQHHLSPSSSSSSSYPTMSSCTIPSVSGSSSSGESTAAEMAEEVAHATGVFVPMSKGPLRLIRKEVMINKRFALEEIPLHI
ncbi:hypothetical protein BG005_007284 [Podila minutissima]|nr:hypothetical protein BG005_007284 [Podila minutissima]